MRLPPGPDWIKVCLYLRTLPEETPLTRAQFASDGKRRLWQWACRQGVPLSVSPRSPSASRWRALVAGQTAGSVLQALPPWVELLDLPSTSASDVISHLENSPHRDAARLWRRLYAALLDRLSMPAPESGQLAVATLRLPAVWPPNVLTESSRTHHGEARPRP